jgi:serine/threonine-protein kinase
VELPAELAEVVLSALAKQRDDRFASVGELADALAQFVPEEGALSAERVYRVLAATNAREARGNSLPVRSASERGATASRLTSERRAKRTGSSSANRASDTVDSPTRRRAVLALVAVLLLIGGGYLLSRTFGAPERESSTGTTGSVAPPLPVLPPRVEAPLAAPPEAVAPGTAPPVQALEPPREPAQPSSLRSRAEEPPASTAREPAVSSQLGAPRVVPPPAPRRTAPPAHPPAVAPGVVAPATDAPPPDGKVRLRDYGGRR